VTSGPQQASFDILFAFPGETLELTAAGVNGPNAGKPDTRFLDALDRWWIAEGHDEANAPEIAPEIANDLPFTGGWFLYLGYELAAEVEPGLQLPVPEDMPVAFATRVPVAVINDHINNQAIVIAEPEATACLASVLEDIASSAALPVVPVSGDLVGDIKEAPPEEFLAAVARAKQYIRDGDVFQANLSRRWEAQLHEEVAPVELYRRLCETNPAPFAGMMVMNDYAVISSSPERLVKRSGLRIDTRPIAGTRPRNESPALLDASREELLDNPKERAEHIMLIDLERNDLGRVCVGGSVEVDEYMVVESYSHVHHIVSNVTGTARPDLTPGELIRAVFPGGTITGCPKVRCMEIIQELEGHTRGAYTGSMGYLNRNGDCDLNILIRTMTQRGKKIELAAGSGVVADSDPQTELNETRAKAKGMLLALREDA
jgi:anthranilate synthase component 1